MRRPSRMPSTPLPEATEINRVVCSPKSYTATEVMFGEANPGLGSYGHACVKYTRRIILRPKQLVLGYSSSQDIHYRAPKLVAEPMNISLYIYMCLYTYAYTPVHVYYIAVCYVQHHTYHAHHTWGKATGKFGLQLVSTGGFLHGLLRLRDHCFAWAMGMRR